MGVLSCQLSFLCSSQSLVSRTRKQQRLFYLGRVLGERPCMQTQTEWRSICCKGPKSSRSVWFVLSSNSSFRSKVLAIDDSGFFQYSNPFRARTNCTDAGSCTEAQGISQGADYWNAQLNERCLKFFKESWKCLMGPSVLPHMLTKTFVFNYLWEIFLF